ncbi:dihydrodipicolinate synthetase [Kockiozyma suomiensis]|uniref:dihydrodipicolinate synthetase n=1 Tax=Kockiozyma suomiensis TaxID=1337062 RepID=UPI0033442589
MTQTSRLVSGVWVPTTTFYTDDDEIDTFTIGKHAVRLAKAGIKGLVTLGSYGEGVLLSPKERSLVNSATRKALDEAGFTDIPVVAGVTEQSVKGAIELTKDAKKAGADAILMVCSSYYRAFVDETVISDFFNGVADASPLPIIIYNYPGVTAGVDISSELLIKLSAHPNIIGTKFTCGNSGKLARVAGAVNAIGPLNTSGATVENGGYFCIAGMADFLTQALAVGGAGTISGPANITPKTVVRVYELFKAGKYAEAFAAQQQLSDSDYVLTNLGPEGTKCALQHFFGYGGHVRRPLQRRSAENVKAMAASIEKYIAFEKSLE